MMVLRSKSWVCLGMLLLVTRLHAEDNPETTPIDPFRIVGNLYYVGSTDLASYLIVTPLGYRAAVAERKAAFEAELMRQQQDSTGDESK
jgi:hypothetical protein